jgi:competence protein ComGC
MMKEVRMRKAIAMIELIFAIVIIAISVLSIPSMMAVADNASKGIMVDEDILKRMMGEITKVSQARWDQNSTAPDFRPLRIAGDLDCNRPDPLGGAGWYRANPDSSMMCGVGGPMMAVNPAAGNLNLSQGIEQLHNNPYNLDINVTGATGSYSVPIEYRVSYITATISAINGGIATATWTLGSSTDMNPLPAAANATHLKRIVARVQKANNPDVDMTLTFFKSNVGKFSE